MKSKITITFEHEGEHCGDCKYLTQLNKCALFNDIDIEEGFLSCENYRCKECLESSEEIK